MHSFLSQKMAISPSWIDNNGHMNLAYYHVLFDQCTDEVYNLLGIGAEAKTSRNIACFAGEVHVRYLNEVFLEDIVQIGFDIIAYDTKKLHFLQTMTRTHDQKICATCEHIALHIDMQTRKVVPFPDDILQNIANMFDISKAAEQSESIGRSIRISTPIQSTV